MTSQLKDEPGLRYDADKVRFDLVPFDAVHEVARVATYGAAKYDERNWEKGMSWSRVVASFMRHLWARMRGERIDPESGLTHVGHMAWNAMALCAFDLREVGTNDLGAIAGGEAVKTAPEPAPNPAAKEAVHELQPVDWQTLDEISDEPGYEAAPDR